MAYAPLGAIFGAICGRELVSQRLQPFDDAVHGGGRLSLLLCNVVLLYPLLMEGPDLAIEHVLQVARRPAALGQGRLERLGIWPGAIQWPSSSLMAMRKARCPSASPSCAKLNPVGLSATTFPARIIVGRHSARSATPALRKPCHSRTLGSEFAKNSARTSSCIKEASRMATSQSEELAIDARQRRADASHAQKPAHDRIGEEDLIAPPFEQWEIRWEHAPAFEMT